MSELPLDDFQKQDIKTDPMTEEQLNEMGQLAGSFESLFSRVAMKYKALGLKDMLLTESDYKRHILKEYTFLKRPIFIIDSEIFIGNSKKNVEAVRLKLTQ
jgi:arsenate reductase